MDLFFTFPQAYLQGKAAENSMLSLQPQEHEKAPLPVEKKHGCCFWEKECRTVAQAGDGESDVLRAGPGWAPGPHESVLPTRLGGQLAWPWSQVWSSPRGTRSGTVPSPSRGHWGLFCCGYCVAGVLAPLPLFPVKFICFWMAPHTPCPTCPHSCSHPRSSPPAFFSRPAVVGGVWSAEPVEGNALSGGL